MKKLQLEFRDNYNLTEGCYKNSTGGGILMTPAIGEDYWVFRVQLHEDQALLAFPKFMQLGIGFAQEDDWNTNLPSRCEVDEIYNHIKKNKKYKQITKAKCIEALTILKKACTYYQENEMEQKAQSNDMEGFQFHFEKMMELVKSKS